MVKAADATPSVPNPYNPGGNRVRSNHRKPWFKSGSNYHSRKTGSKSVMGQTLYTRHKSIYDAATRKTPGAKRMRAVVARRRANWAK